MFAVRSSQFAVRAIYSLIPRTKRGFILFMLVVSALVFAGLYYFANVPSFWYDELYTVGSIRSELTFKDTFNIYAHEEVNSPLYFFIAFFWYRLVPHTERALLSLSILFVIAASIIMGLIGEKLRGIKFGILAFLLVLCNRTVIEYAADEFRAYSLILFVTVINIYFYLQMLHNESWLNIIFYGVTMCLLPYTHYVAVLICFGFFVADCVLIFTKRAGIKVITSYFIGALLFSPWLFAYMLSGMRYSNFWGPAPSIGEILKIGAWLTFSYSYVEIPIFIIIAGVIYFIKIAFSADAKNDRNIIFLISGVFASIFMLLFAYFYCKYINPKGSFFVKRYFFPIVPFSAIIMALGFAYLYMKLKPVFKDKNIIIFTFIITFFCLVNVMHLRGKEPQAYSDEPHREVANLIYKSEQGYKGKSVILSTNEPIFFEGWKELYLTADNTRTCPEALLIPFEAVNFEIIQKVQAGNYDRIYLSYIHPGIKNAELMKWLHSNYDFGDRPGDNKSGDYRFQILERRK